MDERKKLGNWGEEQAVKLLVQKGYKILEKNYYTRYGEIDIIARQRSCLVFVEVKVRRFLEAIEAIDEKKQAKMLNTAQAYLQEEHQGEEDIRFDCVVLEGGPKNYKIKHLEDIIEAT